MFSGGCSKGYHISKPKFKIRSNSENTSDTFLGSFKGKNPLLNELAQTLDECSEATKGRFMLGAACSGSRKRYAFSTKGNFCESSLFRFNYTKRKNEGLKKLRRVAERRHRSM